MIYHKFSINTGKDSARFEKSDPISEATFWSITVSGNLNDDPTSTIELLHELQGHVNKIRAAYGAAE